MTQDDQPAAERPPFKNLTCNGPTLS